MEMYTGRLDKTKTTTFKNGMKLVVSYGTRNDDGVCVNIVTERYMENNVVNSHEDHI